MKKLLWLDDVRNPLKDDWLVFSPIERPFETIWVKSYGEFISWIEANGLPDGICFDHDLGDVSALKEQLEITTWFDLHNNKEYTGYDCAKWLVDYCMNNDKGLPKWNIQSANPVGKDNINGLLNSFVRYLGQKHND